MGTTHWAIGCLGRVAAACPDGNDEDNLFFLNCDLPGSDKYFHDADKGDCYFLDVDGSCSYNSGGLDTRTAIGTAYDTCDDCLGVHGDPPEGGLCPCGTGGAWNAICPPLDPPDDATGFDGDTCAGLASSYSIAGYSDVYWDVSTCSCEVADGRPALTMPMQCLRNQTCRWVPNRIDATSDRSFNGKQAYRFILTVHATLGWELDVGCTGPAGFEQVWKGQKQTGSNPIGNYTRSAGCDPRGTVTIVA